MSEAEHSPSPQGSHLGITESQAAWGGLVIGAAGLLLSLIALYLQYATTHSLNAVVSPTYEPSGALQIGLTLDNPGDFTEIVTDAILLVYRGDGRTLFSSHSLRECDEPIIIPSNSAVYNFSTVAIPSFANAATLPEAPITQHIVLVLYTLTDRPRHVRSTIRLGTITRDPRSGRLLSSDMPTRSAAVRLGGLPSYSYASEVQRRPRPPQCRVN